VSSRPDKIVEAPFTPAVERRSALDRAHRGDIVGAFGRVPTYDTAPRRSWRSRLATLLAIMGPGVVVMVADNDAGGLSVYAQAGQDYGFRLLWLVLALAPVLYVIQEMVARLGAVTGAGHARLIFERFGRRWGLLALGDLLALNLLTIITEFIGVALALGYFGVSPYLSVPLAALALVLVTSIGSFRRWETAMFVFVGLSLLVVPLAALTGVHHSAEHVAATRNIVLGPGGFILLVVAIAGTTVAPWQLFFQQSNVVDKRITPRWIPYERVDLGIGTALFGSGAIAVLVTAAIALGPHTGYGSFVDAGQLAAGLRQSIGGWAGGLFAIALLNGSVLGAAAVTLSTSYALGDVFGTKHSLHRRWRDAPIFHGSFALSLVVAATIVLTPGAPLGIVTLGVQALAGVLLPSATVLLLLLCNDRAVLGPWVNPRWLNVIAVLVVGALLEMSALLMVTILRPGLNLAAAAVGLTVLLAAGFGWFLALQLRSRPEPAIEVSKWERATWSMPPLEGLSPAPASMARSLGLTVLRVYLLLAAAMVAFRILQAILGG
jgi:Mn2+/Fe2+ NRAMP family transporter